jgi:hypothetical protein
MSDPGPDFSIPDPGSPGVENPRIPDLQHYSHYTFLQDQTFCRLGDVQRGGLPGEEQGHAGGGPLQVHVPLPAPPPQASLP